MRPPGSPPARQVRNRRDAYNQLRTGGTTRTPERAPTALTAQADADKNLNRAVSVHSTIMRAHQ